MNKFTAIYIKPWTSTPHRYDLIHYRRIEQNNGETILNMLERESIAGVTLYLFQGHPDIKDLEE